MQRVWEIWRERNARVFRKQETSALGLLAKIRNEAATWALAGAKNLESLWLRDYTFLFPISMKYAQSRVRLLKKMQRPLRLLIDILNFINHRSHMDKLHCPE